MARNALTSRTSLEAHPLWLQTRPVLLGSWARGELAPQSDIDLLFLGPEEIVSQFVSEQQKAGIKIRSRVPESPQDLFQGVEEKDILALLDGLAINKEDQVLIDEHKNRIFKETKLKKHLIQFLKKNFSQKIPGLAPNLKTDAGGLRSINQAEKLALLLKKEISLSAEKKFLLQVRSLTGNDLLTAEDQMQHNISTKNVLIAMRSVERKIQDLLGKTKNIPKFKTDLQLLKKIVDPKTRAEFVQGLFLNRQIFQWRRIQHLEGHVQHDHYHKLPADRHIEKILVLYKQALKKPGLLASFGPLLRSLGNQEKEILGWALLYHDIEKGRQGDHSELGKKAVLEDFKRWKLPKEKAQTIAWLVEFHLALSQAAFRQNPHDPKTWNALWDVGLDSKKLKLLSLLTVLDIQATNPEAWTPWKEKLLYQLYQDLSSGQAKDYQKTLKQFKQPVAKEVLSQIDESFVRALPMNLIAKDLKNVLSKKARSEGFEHYRTRDGKIWIRFAKKKDTSGILWRVIAGLYALGLSVHQAWIVTSRIGIYDWFEVSSSLKYLQLKTRLKYLSIAEQEPQIPEVSFNEITLVSESDKEWVISLRGLDQRGLFLKACYEISAAGYDIQQARIHTWGAQVDDIFHVKPRGKTSELLEVLRPKLCTEAGKS